MTIEQFRERQQYELAVLARDMNELMATRHPAARAVSRVTYALSELVAYHAGWEAEWQRTGKPRHYARGTI